MPVWINIFKKIPYSVNVTVKPIDSVNATHFFSLYRSVKVHNEELKSLEKNELILLIVLPLSSNKTADVFISNKSYEL